MQVKDYKIEELQPYENNPRNNEQAVQYVAESISEFGFKVPIVIDKNKVIVCGHTRYLAAKQLGIKSVPCIMADDLTDEQIKSFRLADNKVSEFSSWNFALLEQELAEIDADMERFGFDLDNVDVNIDDLFEQAEPKEKEPKMIQCPHCGLWFEA